MFYVDLYDNALVLFGVMITLPLPTYRSHLSSKSDFTAVCKYDDFCKTRSPIEAL